MSAAAFLPFSAAAAPAAAAAAVPAVLMCLLLPCLLLPCWRPGLTHGVGQGAEEHEHDLVHSAGEEEELAQVAKVRGVDGILRA